MANKIVLTCTVCSSRNDATQKSHKTLSERAEVRKFCKRCGGHTLHRETK